MLLNDHAADHDFVIAEPRVVGLQDKIIAGAGRCSQCSCTQYSDALDGNYYCRCGHSDGDHW